MGESANRGGNSEFEIGNSANRQGAAVSSPPPFSSPIYESRVTSSGVNALAVSPFLPFTVSFFLVTKDPQINSRQGSHLRLRTAPAKRSRFANLNSLNQFNALTTPLI